VVQELVRQWPARMAGCSLSPGITLPPDGKRSPVCDQGFSEVEE